jgi:hypothetical protein
MPPAAAGPPAAAAPGGTRLPRLLVVHHTSSPALQAMLEAAVAGARDPGLEGIDVTVRPALAANVPDVLAADGFVLGTPANIGYMSGALKYFFDQIYYPCLQAKPRAPYGLYVHGASDTTGAVRAVTSIATGLGWAATSSAPRSPRTSPARSHARRPVATLTGPPARSSPRPGRGPGRAASRWRRSVPARR